MVKAKKQKKFFLFDSNATFSLLHFSAFHLFLLFHFYGLNMFFAEF